ncbi:hypothetical protein [Paraburkholderia kururiensis]|uniref:hypothetical protein n=1 Tax=Paraburkholderia kururiensis TaxID=984307 RepID=UPI0018F3E8BF|nr:hypothetical protein [Paraburkholderia kururiensis]
MDRRRFVMTGGGLAAGLCLPPWTVRAAGKARAMVLFDEALVAKHGFARYVRDAGSTGYAALDRLSCVPVGEDIAEAWYGVLLPDLMRDLLPDLMRAQSLPREPWTLVGFTRPADFFVLSRLAHMQRSFRWHVHSETLGGVRRDDLRSGLDEHVWFTIVAS